MHSLKEVWIDLKNEEDAKTLLTSLPQLELLNGRKTKVNMDTSNYLIQSLDSEINILNYYIEILFCSFRNQKNKMEAFSLDFAALVKQQIEIVNTTASKYDHNTNVLNAKITLYTYIQDVIMTVLPYEGSDKDIITLLSDIIGKIKEHQLALNDTLIKTQQESIALFIKDSEEKDSLIQSLQSELEETKSQLKHFIITNKTIDTENKFLNETITKVKQENNQMTSKIFSKVNDLTASSELTPIETNERQTKETFEAAHCKTDANTNTIIRQSHSNTGYLDLPSSQSPSQKKIKLSSTIKLITENQLLNIIDEIYKSKATKDKSNTDSHLPIETLEQHMYTYLNQKYGLKKIILENATCIINGIKQYSLNNSEICLFGKVMRNEIDEESIAILRELKTIMSQLLLQLIKERNQGYTQEQINQCLSQYKTHVKPLTKDVINIIVSYLLSKDKQGYEALNTKIEEVLGNKEDKVLTYSELMNLILYHHIKTRTKYLMNLTMAFRKVDKDSNGIINQDELLNLIKQFFDQSMNSAQIENVIKKVDQYGLNQITFSQLVSFLQKTPITPKANCSLLDSISSKFNFRTLN